MTWTIETDDEAKKRAQSRAIDERYLICHPDHGLVLAVGTRNEAFKIAERYEMRIMADGSLFCGEPYHVEVYDRMARQRGGQTWKRQPKSGDFSVEHHDWLTADSLWKCIARRGMTPRQTEDLTTSVWR